MRSAGPAKHWPGRWKGCSSTKEDRREESQKASKQMQIEELIGQRIAVLSISGSGKTNTVAVLAEELLSHVPMTICDIEGEYYGLKERFDLLVAGRSDQAEVPLFRENAASLAEVSIQRGISIILDLSEIEPEEMQEILLPRLSRLTRLSSRRHMSISPRGRARHSSPCSRA